MSRSIRLPFVLAALVASSLFLPGAIAQSRQETPTKEIETPGTPRAMRATRSSDACSAPNTYSTLRHFDSQQQQKVFVLDFNTVADSGFVFGTNAYLDRAKGTAFTLPEGVTSATLESVNVYFAYKYTAVWSQEYDIYYTLSIYNGTLETGPQGNPIHTQRHPLIDVKADADFATLSPATTHQLTSPVQVGQTFFVVIDFENYTVADVNRLAIVSTAKTGARVPYVWEQLSTGSWFNVSDNWFGGEDGWNLWIEANLAVASEYTGAPCLQGTKLAAVGIEDYDKFGSSVGISGNFAVVGSTGMRLAGAPDTEFGYLRFFAYDGTRWTQQVKLSASDQLYGERFGSSVAISGNYVVAGAANMGVYDVMDGAGTAYVFTRTNDSWVEQVQITALDADDEDAFGASVGISGDVIAVGATGKNIGTNPNAGAVYVFKRTGGPITPWTEIQRLEAGDPKAEASLGYSVAIDGNYLVAGAPFHDLNTAAGAGAAYIYWWDGSHWTQVARLTASDAKEYGHFGESVAVSGNYVVVGASGQEAAYVFTRVGSGWSEVAKLTPSDLGEYETAWFGTSVAMATGRIVVGAPGKDRAYLFTGSGSTWTESGKLTTTDNPGDFGRRVAVSSDFAFVADPEFQPSMYDPYNGAVFTFNLLTQTDSEPEIVRSESELGVPYPNPVRTGATFMLRVESPQEVAIGVYDLAGRLVAHVHRGLLPAAEHRFTLNLPELHSGVYLLRATGESFTATRRVVLVR